MSLDILGLWCGFVLDHLLGLVVNRLVDLLECLFSRKKKPSLLSDEVDKFASVSSVGNSQATAHTTVYAVFAK